MGQVDGLSVKKWRVLPHDGAAAQKLAARAGIPELLAVLLQTRGIADERQAKRFLSGEAGFSDPFLLPDMEKAVRRILRALDGFEKIAVYGDYDADGVTATAMLYSYLESCGGNVVYYIPEREGEGYGLNKKAVGALHAQGVRLIVTVDNGISSAPEIAFASSLGMDTVVTDHHRAGKELPPACAVVDAWRADSRCPYRDFSGAGVAFKLLSALEGPDGAGALLENYADLAAIGTIGDSVPLTGENRALVRAGVGQISRGDRIGLSALLQQAGLEGRPVTAEEVAFAVVPRINAAGRVGSPDRAVRLLTTESPEEAGGLAAEICRDNGERRRIEADIFAKVMEQFDKDPALLYDRVLVAAGEGWHPGVIGIVAARVTERFGKPCVVISRDGDEAKGSGRSVEGFSLFLAVSACADLLTRFGGHPMAAGLTLPAANIGAFRERINHYAASLPGPMPAPVLRLDCLLDLRALSPDIPDLLRALEPFGMGNPRPLFGLAGVTIRDVTPVGGGKHLRVTVERGGCSARCMKFGTTLEQFAYRPGDTVDLAVSLQADTYNGRRELSVIIRCMRFSGEDGDALTAGRALYEKFRRGEPLAPKEAAALLPTRNDFAAVYRAVRDGRAAGTAEELLARVSGGKMGLPRLLTVLGVLEEFGLIRCERSPQSCSLRVVPREGKVSLPDSRLLSSLKSYQEAGVKNGVAARNV